MLSTCSPPAFSTSAVIRSDPGALLFFRKEIRFLISSFGIISSSVDCSMSGIVSWIDCRILSSWGNSVLRFCSKRYFQILKTSYVSVLLSKFWFLITIRLILGFFSSSRTYLKKLCYSFFLKLSWSFRIFSSSCILLAFLASFVTIRFTFLCSWIVAACDFL